MSNKFLKFKSFNFKVFIFMFGFLLSANVIFADENKESPMIINGDNVEYSTDNKEVIATGNIEVIYKGSKLTCNKLKVNMQTKEGVAEGSARIEDKKGVITGEKIAYDFANKTGVILNADFRANPYFGKAKKVEKVSESEFIAKKGYFTTCNFDQPHYRFGVNKLTMFPGDKLQAEKVQLYLGAVPIVSLPRFNYSMKDPIMHVQVEPGKRKDWGYYILNTWRYNLSEKVTALVSLDYRSKLGLGEGFEINYKKTAIGNGDFKFYYANEKPSNQPSGAPTEFQRYFLRWRDKWTIDPRTNVVAELYKISDERWKYENNPANTDVHNIMQDYFFREYEKDSEPLTYALFHHSFNYSSLDFLLQKRTNHWFDQIEKMPEINYNLPSYQLGETPFYFEDSTSFGSYNRKNLISSSPNQYSGDITVTRLDTTNKVSLPTKLGFLQLKPFVSSRQTFYDQGANGQAGIVRTVFYSGIDLSTKFYRIYNVKTNFLKLDINGLRHVITPTIGYLYTHVPTIPIRNIKQIDSVDAINRGNTATIGLSNKLQTKRNGQSVDFVDFLVTTDYVFDPKSGDNAILTNTNKKLTSQLSDVLFKLKVLPYSWMRFESEVTYEHSDHDSVNYNRFSLANYDFTFDIDKGRTFSIGQRYERKGKNEVTANFTWRLSPKWKFAVYERYNLKKTDNLDFGAQEQQLTITRDLHCWDLDITLDKAKERGTSMYFTFRLKAFPENEFGFDQSMSDKKSGSQ
ncbi:MAG: LPS assembly protein LptD [Candidatus Omnitrophota bacterium]